MRDSAFLSTLAAMRRPPMDWYMGRSRRERGLLLVMLAIAATAFLVIFVWRPLVSARAAAEADIARAAGAIARVQAAEGDLQAQPGAPDIAPTAAVTESVADYALSVRRLEPEGAGARVVLNDAAYADVIEWLEAMDRDYGLHATSVEMERRPEPGVVAADITLER